MKERILQGGMPLEQAAQIHNAERAQQTQAMLQNEVLRSLDYTASEDDGFRVRPINDMIVFRRVASKAQASDALIALPDSVAEQFRLWEVVACGDGHLLLHGERIPLIVKPGDHCIVQGNLTAQLHEGKTIWLAKENMVLAVVRRADAPS